MLTERLELESQHGRKIIGILLFQDLAVVPLLILIPSLGKPPDELAETLAWAGLKAVIVLVLLLFFGQKLMRNWFTIVVKRRSQELFMLNLLLITLGAAWITEQAGLSLALGAFVAGMLISETEYKHQVEEDIKPFRDVLLGLFFITVGMLLNVRLVLENWWLVLVLLARAGAAQVRPDRAAGQAVRRVRRRLDAHRPGAGAGRRIRLRAAQPDRRRQPDRPVHHPAGAGLDGAVDAGGAVHHRQVRPDRDEDRRATNG